MLMGYNCGPVFVQFESRLLSLNLMLSAFFQMPEYKGLEFWIIQSVMIPVSDPS